MMKLNTLLLDRYNLKPKRGHTIFSKVPVRQPPCEVSRTETYTFQHSTQCACQCSEDLHEDCSYASIQFLATTILFLCLTFKSWFHLHCSPLFESSVNLFKQRDYKSFLRFKNVFTESITQNKTQKFPHSWTCSELQDLLISVEPLLCVY